MRRTGWARQIQPIGLCAALLLYVGTTRGQEIALRTATAEPALTDAGTLTDAIRELRAQVQALNEQVSELRAQSQSARDEVQELRLALDTKQERAKPSPGLSPQSAALKTPSPATNFATDSTSATDQQSNQAHFEQIEEDVQLSNAKLNDQDQTKVESGSKYRLRLSGIVLLNLFDNRGNVDNFDVPELALPEGLLGSMRSFGGSLRQSQIGLQVFGPNVGSSHTSAEVKFDFAGTFPKTPNGVALGQVRLRTGTVRMDWANTSIVAGQDSLFFAPLTPTSLASLAVPALAYSGNLWGWIPQIRVEHRLNLAEGTVLAVQAGILDSFSGDLPYNSYDVREASWGEQSGQPAYALRAAWTQHAFGQRFTLGFGGYYGRQDWGFGRKVDGWAGITDLTLPLSKYFELTTEFYRGRATAGIGGAIGQDVVMNGSIIAPATSISGVDSMGGWTQLKFKPRANLELNGAFGEENPFARELRENPNSFSYFGQLISRNQSEFGNFIYHVRSNMLFSVEYRHLNSSLLTDGTARANQVNAAVGYLF